MLSEEALERLSERLVDRVEGLNAFMINKLGTQLVNVGKFTPSQVREVLQSVKYGNDLDEIMVKIADVTNKNVEDIYSIFEEVAKLNQEYAKQFYDYKKVNFIPFEENPALRNQVKNIAKVTANEYVNMSKTFAYAMFNEKGIKEYTSISDIYQKITDEAILGISQGRTSYEMAIKKAMKDMTSNGLRVVNYASGYSRRADSSIRLNIAEGIKRLNREVQATFGKEFGADGVEISHHKNAAPDHIDTVDGRQFSLNGNKTVNGVEYEDYNTINTNLERHVGDLNCQHYPIQIVLGVSEPLFSKEEIETDKRANMNGFEFEGNHYTNYEGTQLQRQIETKIRQYKDRQIGAKAINDVDEVYHCQEKIRQLTDKYKELSDVSGLPPKIDRLRVDGYRSVNVNKIKDSNILGQSESVNISKSTKTFVEKIKIDQIDNKIQNYNDIIRDKKVEFAYVIQKDGNVFNFVGNEETVNIYDIDFDGATITHNHLKDKYDDIYKSFGEDDLTFLKKHPKINKLYETNAEYDYVVKVLKPIDVDKTTARNKGLELMLQEVGIGDEQHYMFKWLRNEGYVEYERFNRRTKEKD